MRWENHFLMQEKSTLKLGNKEQKRAPQLLQQRWIAFDGETMGKLMRAEDSIAGGQRRMGRLRCLTIIRHVGMLRQGVGKKNVWLLRNSFRRGRLEGGGTENSFGEVTR